MLPVLGAEQYPMHVVNTKMIKGSQLDCSPEAEQFQAVSLKQPEGAGHPL